MANMTLSPNLSPDAKQSSPLVSPLLNDPSCIRADDEEEVKRKVRWMELALSLFSLMCYDKSGLFLLLLRFQATSGACLDGVSYKSELAFKEWSLGVCCNKTVSSIVLERKFPGDGKKSKC